MNVLAIFASPRSGGNLSKMLEATLDAAVQSGGSVQRIDLYQQALSPCAGCMACRKDGVCVLNDELAPIREALLRCDVVILAAPTYFANVPGPVKTLFDRLSGAVMEEGKTGIPHGKLSKRQRYLLLTACTTPAPFDWLCGQSRGTLHAMDEFFRTAGMRRMGAIVYAGTKGRKGLPSRLEARLRGVWR